MFVEKKNLWNIRYAEGNIISESVIEQENIVFDIIFYERKTSVEDKIWKSIKN